MPRLAHIALLVADYDEALAYYVGRLGFALVEDTPVPEQNKRWVTIRPPGAPGNATTILLARAVTPEQARFIGDQAGGRVFLIPRHRRLRARPCALHGSGRRAGAPAGGARLRHGGRLPRLLRQSVGLGGVRRPRRLNRRQARTSPSSSPSQ